MSDPARDAPAIRASDAERERAIERLRAAAGEGRLTLEELADRVEAASRARTREELAQLARDLPDEAGAPLAVAPTRNSVVFADLRRDGAWPVPPRSRWDTVFGDVVLDLRQAQVAGATVEVHATTVFGDIRLLVPERIVVEVRARAVLGDVVQRAGAVAPAGAPRVVLTGWTVFGDVRVEARRLRERLAERWRARGRP